MTTQHAEHAGIDFNKVAADYEKIIGPMTGQIAEHLVSISPPFSSSSKIFDNATGTGVIMNKIQARIAFENPELKVTATATDIAPPMINVLRAKTTQQPTQLPNLDLSCLVIPAENLDEAIVPDNSITHYYMNFGLFHCSDPAKAAKHIYRSLAPGGTAYITSWHDAGYWDAINKTETKPVEFPFSSEWLKPSYNKQILTDAGFEQDKVEMSVRDCFFRASSPREMAKNCHNMINIVKHRTGAELNNTPSEDWLSRMEQNLVNDDRAVQEDGNGFAMKMSANIAVCKK